MAICHVCMVGCISGEIEVIRDENGRTICCVFEMLVKQKQEKILFAVYIDAEDLLHECDNKLVTGRVVLVSGILEVDFHNIKISSLGTRKNSIPIITSNMTIICNDICIMYRKQDYEHISNMGKITPIEAAKCNPDTKCTYDLDTELPF